MLMLGGSGERRAVLGGGPRLTEQSHFTLSSLSQIHQEAQAADTGLVEERP